MDTLSHTIPVDTGSQPSRNRKLDLSQQLLADKVQQQKTKRGFASAKKLHCGPMPLPAASGQLPLTLCSSRLFITILWNRWLSYMTSNGYLNPSIQKAFMSTTPGCVEHHLKLVAILAEPRNSTSRALYPGLSARSLHCKLGHTMYPIAGCRLQE